jgi:DNA-binding NtrC family response regulator
MADKRDKMKKKKILVVDDEVDFVNIIKIRLEANNYEVITASGGKEALEKVLRDKPDVVLLDVLMPEIGGIDALAKIRQTDKDLPVFMITGFSNEERFASANKLNATGFIMKTSDLQKEIEKIKAIIG